MPPDAAASIRASAATLGLGLDDRQVAALAAYLALLQRWNATYNLTAVRDEQEMLIQHLADCLAVVPAVRRWRQQHPTARRVLDVGSGGGLPGVVLAIVEPALQVVCVDTVGKKAAFIRQAGLELRLGNLAAAHARVEALREPPFDLIACRAFAALADFTRLTLSSLASDGVWMAMKGRRPDDEIAALPPAIEVFHVEQLNVPGLSAERCLVWMRRRAAPAPQSG